MRALRLLKTFHRTRGVLEVVMEKDDEIRAIEVMTRTLKKLPSERARHRVLDYVRDVLDEAPRQHVFVEVPVHAKVDGVALCGACDKRPDDPIHVLPAGA